MHANETWIAMFRRIPGSLHESLALGLTTGSEIVVQKIMKLEPDFMIVRGRLAGTQDTGRIVLIPYGELAFVALTKPLKDPEVEAIFGQGEPPALADLPAGDEPTLEDATVNDPPAAVNPSRRPEMVSKSALLAKLRERLK